ncbi:hypothetical protein, partial [Dokdonella sp.]|uniref:hypothetical protein n=1 Tax=Dokdonella sp. TaxID=2291710 RepID=UPI002F4129E2
MIASSSPTFHARTSRVAALAALYLGTAFAPLAHADIAITGTSAPTTYARGRINSFLLDLHLISNAFAGADALTFQVPVGVTLSAVRKRNTFTFCSDVHPLVDGVGTSDGGWYPLGWPALDGCGSFAGSPDPGEEQIVIVDLDVPAGYTGDLPLTVHAVGDGNGDPPNEADLVITLGDEGAPTQPILAVASKLAVATQGDMQSVQTLAIGNTGAGTLDYTITTTLSDGVTPPDCGTPAIEPWLTFAPASGAVAAGAHADVSLTFDASIVAAGTHMAALCIASNDPAEPMRAIPLQFDVAATSCAAADRLFANGFDDDADGACANA